MIKILHTSDVHLGAKLNWLGEKSGDQKNQILQTFERTVELAIQKRVDLFLIAGDLFDSFSPHALSISFVKSQFEKLAANNIYTVLIAGNHDRLETNSVLRENEFIKSAKGFCFKNPGCGVINILTLDLNIFAYSVEKQFSNVRPLVEANKLFEQTTKAKFNIGLIHGSVVMNNSQSTNYPIYTEDIASSGFDYIALGDWHSVLDVSNHNKAWYSGSPEMISKSQANCGYVLYIEIDEAATKVEPIKVGSRKIENLKINIDKYADDINQGIINELNARANTNLIINVEIEGKKTAFQQIQFEQLKTLFSDKFFYVDFKDSTQLKITDADLAKYPESTLIGRYVKNIKTALEQTIDDHEKEILEEALGEGVQRILNSK